MNELIGCNDNITVSDEYKLTPAEARILEVCLNPEHTGKNITEKCKIACVSRNHWYETLRKPEFKALQNKTITALVSEKIAEVVSATVKFAIKDSRCHSDRKALMQMTGLIQSEQSGNVTLIQNNFQLPQLEAELQQIQEKRRELEMQLGTDFEVVK